MTSPEPEPGSGFAEFVTARVLSAGGSVLPAKLAETVRHAVHPVDLIRGPVGVDGGAGFEAECYRIVTVPTGAAFDPAGPKACPRCALAVAGPDEAALAAQAAAVAARAQARRERKAACSRARRARNRAAAA